MKFKLSALTASSRQEPLFLSDLKFEDAPRLPGVATVDELARELPVLSGTGEPIPIVGSSEGVVDSLPTVSDSADDSGVRPASWGQADGESQEGIERDVPETDSLTAGDLSTSGEAKVEESVSVGVPVPLIGTAETPGSFLGENWHYLLFVVMLFGWVLSRMLAAGEPSFKPKVSPGAVRDEEGGIANSRGQFKRSERFMKPKEKEDPEDGNPEKGPGPPAADAIAPPAVPDVIEGKLTQQQRAEAMPVDQPSDDDFDFDLEGGVSDSDVFSLEDAAEISKTADSKKSGASSKRFKTEEDVSLAGDDFEVEDEFVSFDDEDSQLSLADSDTEFGFDLGDEESSSFLDSGKTATETLAKSADDADDADAGLGDLSIGGVAEAAEDVVSDVTDGAKVSAAAGAAAAGAVAVGAAAKGGFFSRLFGAQDKKQNTVDVVDNLVGDTEVGSVDLSEAAPVISGQVDPAAAAAEPFEVPGVGDGSLNLDDVADVGSVESFGFDDEDSGDFDFDLETDDDEIGLPTAVESDGDESSELVLDASDLDDSGELLLDLGDEDAPVDELENLVAEPAVEEVSAGAIGGIQEEVAVESNESDSGEFGFGLFEEGGESQEEAVEVAQGSSGEGIDSESSVSAPVVAAATAALGAGLAGIGMAGSGSADQSESDSQWEAKHRAIEDENSKLSSQVASMTRQLEETKAAEARSGELQQECDALNETVKSLGAEKDDLLKEKEQIDKEKNQLAEQLEETKAAEARSGELQQECDALNETVKSLGAEKDDLLKEKEQVDKEKNQLAEQLSAAEKNGSTWEQEKADLIEQQEGLKSEVAAFAEERSEFESENKALQAKLADAEAKPAESAAESSESIEELRERFKLRLASEHRKRKEAEQLVEEAEGQRNEVAKLLRAAKAELKELKS